MPSSRLRLVLINRAEGQRWDESRLEAVNADVGNRFPASNRKGFTGSRTPNGIFSISALIPRGGSGNPVTVAGPMAR